MGKANRIRSGRNNAPSAKKNSKKNSSFFYTLALALVAAFVAIVIIASSIFSTGVIMRSKKAMYTDNYTVNGTVLQYMFMADYQDFLNTYSYYVSAFGLDTSKSLAKQEFSSTAASFLGSFDGTWKDYFMSTLKSQTEQLLVYCEVANEKGIELDDDDIAAIDEAIHSLEHSASDSGYSVDSFLEMYYGKGVKIKDVRQALELSSLAAKVAEVIDAELMDAITDDEINTKYADDEKNYNVKDYIYYTMSVEYDEVAAQVVPEYDGSTELTDEQKAEVLEAYKNKIEETKAKAEAFENYTDVEDFKNAVLEDIAYTSFDSFYETEALADADKLSDTDLHTVKVALIAEVIDEVKNGSESADATVEADGVYTAYGVTLAGENTAKAIDSIKTKLYSSLESASESYFTQKVKYDSTNAIPKWAFDEVEGIGETKSLSYGDGSKDGEIEAENGYFDIAVYMVASDEYCDKTLAKNIGYMTFADEASAKKAIEAFKASETKDYAAFEAVAESNSAATVGKFENYLEGELSYGTYETWLYDDETVVGSITETPITNSSTTTQEYAIFFYYADGDEAWYIDVKNAIFVDDYQEYYKTITEKYPVTVVDKVLDEIDV